MTLQRTNSEDDTVYEPPREYVALFEGFKIFKLPLCKARYRSGYER